jgi:hypothetical protein
MAQEAWKTFREADPYPDYSAHYAQGFKQGFVEQLTTGGRGQLFPVPPKRYRKSRCHTPQDFQAGEDWLAGYLHGAAAAQDGGYGQISTVPTDQHPTSAVSPDPILIPRESAPNSVPDIELPLPQKVSPRPGDSVNSQPMGPQ